MTELQVIIDILWLNYKKSHYETVAMWKKMFKCRTTAFKEIWFKYQRGILAEAIVYIWLISIQLRAQKATYDVNLIDSK